MSVCNGSTWQRAKAKNKFYSIGSYHSHTIIYSMYVSSHWFYGRCSHSLFYYMIAYALFWKIERNSLAKYTYFEYHLVFLFRGYRMIMSVWSS